MDRWEDSQADLVVSTMRPLSVGLGGFLLWTAWQQAGTVPGGGLMTFGDVLAGSILLALGLIAVRWPFHPHWGHPWAFLAVVLTTFTSTMTLIVRLDGQESLNFALILIAASVVFASARWLIAAAGIVVAAWVAVSRALPVTDVASGDFLIEIGLIVGAAVHWGRRRSLERLADALEHAHDRRQHHEQLSKDLDAFATTLSHDLQAPLTALRLQSSVARAAVAKNDPERIQKALRTIDDISVETGEFVQSLLQYARYGTEKPDPMAVDLDAILADVCKYLQGTLRGAHIKVETLPRVRADPVQMQHLFMHLLANCAHNRRPDEPLTIEVQGKVRGDRCELWVQDNGKGFDVPDLDRLFVPFEHGRQDEKLGHGLGLATCRRIVENNGGEIRAVRADRGARFLIELPAARNE